MEGPASDFFLFFKSALLKGLLALRAHLPSIAFLVKTVCYQSTLPCFDKFELAAFLDRFKPDYSPEQLAKYVDWLVDTSLNSKRTVWYDEFQKMTNNIEP